MADLQKTVEIIFGGRNDLSKVIGNVERSLDSLTGATQPFADMADNVLRAEFAVLALGTAFAGLSISQAGEFSGQFAEITTMIDVNVSELGGYRQEILDYATDSTQSLDSITGAVYSALSAGVDYTTSLAVMSDAEKLAVAGKADLTSTLKALASTMNAYGASTDEATDYSDIFFTTVKQGQTTIPELAASLAQVTGTAVAAGVPFDDLSAAIAALTASGMPTSQAITSIKAALSNIIKPSAQARAEAKELEVQFNATALKTQGLGGFMQTLYEATGGNIETMGKLFGSTEAVNGVMALAADKSGIFAKALEGMEKRAGATATAYEKMVKNIDLQNQRLVNNIEVVLVKIGTNLLDEYKDIVDNLVLVLKGIGSAVDKGDFDGLIKIFESAMKDIKTLVAGIAKVLPEALEEVNWSGLESSLSNLKESLGGAFEAVFGDIDLSTAKGVEEGIQKAVDLLSGLTNLSAGVIDGMRPLFNFLGEVVDKFAAMDEEGKKAVGVLLGLGKSAFEISNFLSAATGAAGAFGNAMLMIGGSSMLNAVRGLVGSLGTAGLAGSMAGATTAAATLGPAVLAFAAAFGVTKIYALGKEIIATKNAISEADDAADRATASAARLAEKYREISEATGVQITTSQEFHKAIKDGQIVFDGATKSWHAAALDFEAIEWNLDPDGNILGMVTTIEEELTKLSDQQAFDDLKAQFIALGNSPEIAAAMANIEMETQRIPDAVEKAKKDVEKESDKLIAELAKIASTERIKTMELAVEFNVEQLKSDTEIMTSLIDGIGTAIESTGQLMGTLTGQFLEADTWRDKFFMEDLIEAEEDRRQDAFDLQKKLTEAEIDLIDQRTKALKNGDALIKIESDGLEPALELILWEVLERVQVKVSEDAGAFLLGAT